MQSVGEHASCSQMPTSPQRTAQTKSFQPWKPLLRSAIACERDRLPGSCISERNFCHKFWICSHANMRTTTIKRLNRGMPTVGAQHEESNHCSSPNHEATNVGAPSTKGPRAICEEHGVLDRAQRSRREYWGRRAKRKRNARAATSAAAKLSQRTCGTSRCRPGRLCKRPGSWPAAAMTKTTENKWRSSTEAQRQTKPSPLRPLIPHNGTPANDALKRAVPLGSLAPTQTHQATAADGPRMRRKTNTNRNRESNSRNCMAIRRDRWRPPPGTLAERRCAAEHPQALRVVQRHPAKAGGTSQVQLALRAHGDSASRECRLDACTTPLLRARAPAAILCSAPLPPTSST